MTIFSQTTHLAYQTTAQATPFVRRSYTHGALIPTTPDLLLQVEDGVVAQVVIHSDGEPLVGRFLKPECMALPCVVQIRNYNLI